ncbi:MAG: DUF1566 domain-containing protein, partial [Myxococcota bacterium]
VGPVLMYLDVFDTEALNTGTSYYREIHPNVILDSTGGFNVQIGAGVTLSDPFSPSLFDQPERWVQVEALSVGETDGLEVLPRVKLSSVPWALIAERVAPWDGSTAPRFDDCGDGTVADRKTGLQWEKKTGVIAQPVSCDTTGCPDANDVNNRYRWTNTGVLADGDVFTDFLARLNGEFDPQAATGCFADRCDWRLPTIAELQTILIGPDAAPGQATSCSASPCIDSDFAAISGPVPGTFVWSSSETSGVPSDTWSAAFSDGTVSDAAKTLRARGRAVRAGACE